MSSPLDLTTIVAVRNYLTALATPLQASINTLIAAGVVTAGSQVVTPGLMANIALNVQLAIDVYPYQEIVTVTAVTSTTFTATFTMAHAAGVTVMLGQDSIIQQAITSAGMTWLRMTGEAPDDGTVPDQSPFVTQVAFNEWYKGTGSSRLFLRHRPVASVQLLTIGTWQINASTAINQSGYFIDRGRSLVLRCGGSSTPYVVQFQGWFGSPNFWMPSSETPNVNVQYTAGYAAGPPPDIYEKCTKMVAVTCKRRAWLDQKSQTLAGQETITYRDWVMDPDVRDVMQRYTRKTY